MRSALAFQYLLRRRAVTFRLGEEVTDGSSCTRDRVVTHLESGKQMPSETLMYATGRQGATDGLGLEKRGRGRQARPPAVDESFRTPVAHSSPWATSPPARLAATGMEQGRIAAMTRSGSRRSAPELIPTGIYAIPEISLVGRTEEQRPRRRCLTCLGHVVE